MLAKILGNVRFDLIMRSPKGNALPINALFLIRTNCAGMVRKNQPGNFASCLHLFLLPPLLLHCGCHPYR